MVHVIIDEGESMVLRSLTGAALALLMAGGAWAQTADSSLTFEVATVKPASLPASPDGKRVIRIGAQGGPGTSDPSQISYSFLSLRNLLMQAFNVRNYQIQGPAWLDSERFDIVARVPAGARKDDVPVMLRNLLKERFQLAAHRETKEQSVYALVVGKSAPKMKLSEDQSDPSAAAPSRSPSESAAPEGGALPPPDPGRPRIGKDGMPELPPGMRRPGIRMMALMSPAGMRVRLSAERQTMAQLADSLSNQVDRPVVDMTGLTQRYDFTLDFAPDQAAMMAKMGALPGGIMPPPLPGGAGPAPGEAGPRLAAPETDAATVFVAVQEQLGLRLEPRKAPADILVIDHLEKIPSEN
jgi:uncharacterized protein (TIGR03435 family)